MRAMESTRWAGRKVAQLATEGPNLWSKQYEADNKNSEGREGAPPVRLATCGVLITGTKVRFEKQKKISGTKEKLLQIMIHSNIFPRVLACGFLPSLVCLLPLFFGKIRKRIVLHTRKMYGSAPGPPARVGEKTVLPRFLDLNFFFGGTDQSLQECLATPTATTYADGFLSGPSA